ncbi:stage III sporulation protein AE [Gracilibacillus halotolerans]|uniref:Stage III sporulation protein AE n=1 Tax=Gracilibacillus halotolerans TaxID=74386 RepID=A0A841RH05_9BACI|nr:stage III sporulation protein AE [Gracilibacillus halotolerans]MBB6511759.1 stage III sporulation protein AE [Gracilibacillus halotolerans]
MNVAKIIICLCMLYIFLPMVNVSGTDGLPAGFDSLIDNSEVEQYWDYIGEEYRHVLPDWDKEKLWATVKGDTTISMKEWFVAALHYLFYEIAENGKLLATLLLLTLFCILLQTIQNAFEKKVVSKVAYSIVYIMLIILAMQSFYLAATYVVDTIKLTENFLIALLPLLLGVLASLGHLVSVSFFHPMIILLIHVSVFTVSRIVIPLFLVSAILQMVSTISSEHKATKLANLIKNLAISLMGILLTVFLGVISVQGTVSAIQDGIAMRAAKFVTGNFIPVIGRIFTDATDTVLSATMLVKNAIGVVGVIILIAIVLFPAIKIFVLSLMYKITTALLQPIGDGPIIECLDIIGKHILYLFAALLLVTFMFFFTIVILMMLSNVTMMVR